jgi:hypothetical protein
MTVLTRKGEYFRIVTYDGRKKKEWQHLDQALADAKIRSGNGVNPGPMVVVATENRIWSPVQKRLLPKHRRLIAVYRNGRRWDNP